MRRRIAMTIPAIALLAGLANPAAAQFPDRNFVVFFGEWSAAFDASANAVIAAAAAGAKADPTDHIIIVGTADPVGSARSNALISALRAELVSEALIASGVDAARIEQHGAGEAAYQLSPQESRRVTISIGSK